jgi:hypothetical protein
MAARQSSSSLAATNTGVYKASQAVNQFGSANSYTSSSENAWFGSDSYGHLGMQFQGVSFPSDGTLTSAYVEFTPNTDQWIGQSSQIYGEKSDNPTLFSSSSLPSVRSKTLASVSYSDNTKWVKDMAYRLPPITGVISELISRGSTKDINIIIKGAGSQYGRKFIYGSGSDKGPKLILEFSSTIAQMPTPTPVITVPSATPLRTSTTVTATPLASTSTTMTHTTSSGGESMAMMAWRVGGKNAPNLKYDKCDDGTDVVTAHNRYYVVAYDGMNYPTWHPPVVTNPVTGVGKCYFGHEHGTNPQSYQFWNEIVQQFGKDINGDGVITKMTISSTGQITPGDRAGLPFGIANEHMDSYYNQEGRDSIFVRHEDHVGHKVEIVNNESEMNGNSTHVMSHWQVQQVLMFHTINREVIPIRLQELFVRIFINFTRVPILEMR